MSFKHRVVMGVAALVLPGLLISATADAQTRAKDADRTVGSGVRDDQPGVPPNGLPGEDAVTFTRAGTYHYYCGIHGKTMAGDIVVQ